jgi:hypothetical protein
MMLAPAGIIATASSTEMALMVETPDERRSMKGGRGSDVDEGRGHTFDLCQGFSLIRAGIIIPTVLPPRR